MKRKQVTAYEVGKEKGGRKTPPYKNNIFKFNNVKLCKITIKRKVKSPLIVSLKK